VAFGREEISYQFPVASFQLVANSDSNWKLEITGHFVSGTSVTDNGINGPCMVFGPPITYPVVLGDMDMMENNLDSRRACR
jgi:hypothetical protein